MSDIAVVITVPADGLASIVSAKPSTGTVITKSPVSVYVLDQHFFLLISDCFVLEVIPIAD